MGKSFKLENHSLRHKKPPFCFSFSPTNFQKYTLILRIFLFICHFKIKKNFESDPLLRVEKFEEKKKLNSFFNFGRKFFFVNFKSFNDFLFKKNFRPLSLLFYFLISCTVSTNPDFFHNSTSSKKNKIFNNGAKPRSLKLYLSQLRGGFWKYVSSIDSFGCQEINVSDLFECWCQKRCWRSRPSSWQMFRRLFVRRNPCDLLTWYTRPIAMIVFENSGI